MKPPRITVLMPARNAARFLREALDSIFMQTFCDFELLVVDDGSMDDTPHIVASYQDDRMRTVRLENSQGLTEALNVGLAAAKGEYIARMDSDDISYAHRLARQRTFLEERPEVVMVGSWADIIDHEGRRVSVMRPPTGAAELAEGLLNGNRFVHTMVMFRRREVLALGGYRALLPHAQDYDLWLRLA